MTYESAMPQAGGAKDPALLEECRTMCLAAGTSCNGVPGGSTTSGCQWGSCLQACYLVNDPTGGFYKESAKVDTELCLPTGGCSRGGFSQCGKCDNGMGPGVATPEPNPSWGNPNCNAASDCSAGAKMIIPPKSTIVEIGCYKDAPDRDMEDFKYIADNSPEQCKAHCEAMEKKYFGLQYTHQCFCSNSYGKHGTASNCDRLCPGAPTIKCGGAWAQNVYEIVPPPPAGVTVQAEFPWVPAPVTLGEKEWNDLWTAAPLKIAKRTCAGCADTHKEVYYRRTTSLDTFKPFYYLMNNWMSCNNKLGEDFELYSTEADALAQTNGWTYCNYDDPGVGFPRDCGPTGGRGWQWNSENTAGAAFAAGCYDKTKHTCTCKGMTEATCIEGTGLMDPLTGLLTERMWSDQCGKYCPKEGCATAGDGASPTTCGRTCRDDDRGGQVVEWFLLGKPKLDTIKATG